MLLSCPALNAEQRFAFTTLAHTPGMWHIALPEKSCGLKQGSRGDIIVLTNIEDERRKWVFAKIRDNHFHWQDVVVKDDGKWHVNFDLYAERME